MTMPGKGRRTPKDSRQRPNGAVIAIVRTRTCSSLPAVVAITPFVEAAVLPFRARPANGGGYASGTRETGSDTILGKTPFLLLFGLPTPFETACRVASFSICSLNRSLPRAHPLWVFS